MNPEKALPSLEGQRQSIVDHAHMLNHATKVHIAQIVTMAYEDGRTENGKVVVIEDPDTGYLNILVNNIDSPECVTQVYRAVMSLVESLGRPAN